MSLDRSLLLLFMSSKVNISSDDAYTGVMQAINQPATHMEILDDLELMQDNVGLNLGDTDEGNIDSNALEMSELMKSIKEVSKGVSEKTAKEYAR